MYFFVLHNMIYYFIFIHSYVKAIVFKLNLKNYALVIFKHSTLWIPSIIIMKYNINIKYFIFKIQI